MARAIKEIYNEIIEEKENLTSLSDLGYTGENANALLTSLNSGSKVAIWRLWAYIMAATIYFHEKLWDLYKAEVEQKLRAIPGTDAWLAQECKRFQENDATFSLNSDGTYGYATIDPDKQIIKRVAVTSEFGNTIVKVATQTEEGGPLSSLNSEQLAGFEGFLQAIQYAGSSITALSTESDKVQMELSIYHSGLVPIDDLKDSVEGAIQGYLSNLEFNGAFKVIKLIDAIQQVESITDVSIESMRAKPAGPIAQFPYREVPRAYDPASGYLEIYEHSEEADGQPAYNLRDAINYIIE
jgi:uncharacterized membrane protein